MISSMIKFTIYIRDSQGLRPQGEYRGGLNGAKTLKYLFLTEFQCFKCQLSMNLTESSGRTFKLRKIKNKMAPLAPFCKNFWAFLSNFWRNV